MFSKKLLMTIMNVNKNLFQLKLLHHLIINAYKLIHFIFPVVTNFILKSRSLIASSPRTSVCRGRSNSLYNCHDMIIETRINISEAIKKIFFSLKIIKESTNVRRWIITTNKIYLVRSFIVWYIVFIKPAIQGAAGDAYCTRSF